MTNLSEDLLLLAIQPDGGWLGGGLGPDEELGVTAVAQLVIDGAVTLRDGRIEILNGALFPEELAPLVPQHGAIADVVAALGPLTKNRGLAELEGRNVIAVTRKRFLGVLPTVTIRIVDPGPRAAALARVTALVDGRKVAEPEATALLIAILDATGRLPYLLPLSRERKEEILGGMGGGTSAESLIEEVRRSLEQLRVAVYTSVILPTVLRPG